MYEVDSSKRTYALAAGRSRTTPAEDFRTLVGAGPV